MLKKTVSILWNQSLVNIVVVHCPCSMSLAVIGQCQCLPENLAPLDSRLNSKHGSRYPSSGMAVAFIYWRYIAISCPTSSTAALLLSSLYCRLLLCPLFRLSMAPHHFLWRKWCLLFQTYWAQKAPLMMKFAVAAKKRSFYPKKEAEFQWQLLCYAWGPRRPAASNAWTDTAAVGNFMGQYCGVFLIFTLA